MAFSLGAFFSKAQGSSGKNLPVGVDLSAAGVRVVQLARRGKQLSLAGLAFEPIGRDVFADGQIADVDAVALAIRRAMQRSGSKQKNIAMALPRQAVMSKTFSVPADLRGDELTWHVEANVSQYVPFSTDEVNWDYATVPAKKSNADAQVVLVAAKQEAVEDYQAVAEAAGLNLQSLEVDNYAAHRIYAWYQTHARAEGRGKKHPSKPRGSGAHVEALFQIGLHATDLQVFDAGELIFERTVQVGSGVLMQKIAKQYAMSLEEAQARQRANDLPSDYHSILLRPHALTLGYDLAQALQYFYASSSVGRVDGILLAGEESDDVDLVTALTEKTQIPAKTVNPFTSMELPSKYSAPRSGVHLGAYHLACGIALRGMEDGAGGWL